ncbi:MAG: MFS transporter [Chthonomonadales bacterium]|nr:MFS transporter [Chthonomonadales bacterium]
MGADRRPLTRLETLRALKLSNLEAVAATVHVSLTGGAFQTGFALWLGASSFWMGVIGAVPTIAALVQLGSSLLVERLGERKALTAWFSLIARTLWLPILLLPWVLSGELRLIGFVVLLTLSSVAIQVPVPAFTSWLSDLVPADHRGRYFGRRNMLAGLTTMAASLPPAWFLDRAVARGWVSEPAGFAVLFGVAVVFGLISFALLLRTPEPPMAKVLHEGAHGASGMLAAYRAPLRDAGFRKVLWFGGLFAVGQFLAAPFYTVYALQELKLSYMWLQVLGAAASLAALASMPLWGYLADRFGNRPLLIIAVVGVSAAPLPWVAARPDAMVTTLVILILGNLMGGVMWAGVGLLQFNVVIEATPSEGRSVYVGALSAITGLAGGLAPIAGGLIIEGLRQHPVSVLGVSMNAYHMLFAINAVTRIVTLPLVRALPASSAASASEVLGQLGAVRVSSLIQMQRLQRGQTETERRKAVNALSASRLSLAVQELTQALNDPSHRVRREAARALGEIGDASAVRALVERLEDPSPSVALEAAEALGRIGGPESSAHLARLLDSDNSEMRGAAARALARIGDRARAHDLTVALERALERREWDEAQTFVEALGHCGDHETAMRLVDLLTHEQRGIRSAVYDAIGELGDASVGGSVEAAYRKEADPTVLVHGAFALAATGRVSALPAMYASLRATTNDVARKQIASAIGVLLGDQRVYRVLASGAMDQDLAVVRMIRELGVRRKDDTDFGWRRRSKLAQSAAEAFGEGDLSRAGEILAKIPRHWGPVGEMLDHARQLASTGPCTVEEVVVVVAGVHYLLTTAMEAT